MNDKNKSLIMPTWEDNQTPVNAANLNSMVQSITQNSNDIEILSTAMSLLNDSKLDKVELQDNILKFYAKEVVKFSIEIPTGTGESGIPGQDGRDGREIELRKGETDIEWSYVGEENWKQLVSLEELKGQKGQDGQKGADGTPGRDGQDGESPTLEIGNVSTLEPGSRATASVRLISENRYAIDLGIPRGAKGQDGTGGGSGSVVNPTLEIGSVSSGEVASAEIVGDSPNYTINLVLPKGEQGPQGYDGVTPNITIGEVTTLPAGSGATVTKRGTIESPIFDFGIPQGEKGADGVGTGGTGGGLTTTQSRQLQTAYEHSQSKHLSLTDVGRKTYVNVIDDLGVVPNNQSSEVMAENSRKVKEWIDQNYNGDKVLYFPINKYWFNLIEITDTEKVYWICMEGETALDREQKTGGEYGCVMIFTDGTNGFINRTNTTGTNEIRFSISHIRFLQNFLYDYVPSGMCLGVTTNLGREYNFDFFDVMFHGYEYGFKSPGYTCGRSVGKVVGVSHCIYGIYIGGASHRLKIEDFDIGYCQYGLRLDVGGHPCEVKDIHIAVGVMPSLKDKVDADGLMYGIHTKGDVVLDGLYYEEYASEVVNMDMYYLYHVESYGGGGCGKVIIKNSPIGEVAAGKRGKFLYYRKYVGAGAEETDNPVTLGRFTANYFPHGTLDLQNCLPSSANTERITRLLDVGDGVGVTIDGKNYWKEGISCSKTYVRHYRAAITSRFGHIDSKPQGSSNIGYFGFNYLADEDKIYEGVSQVADPARDNVENFNGVHYRGSITIENLTQEDLNVVFGIVGQDPTTNEHMIASKLCKLDSSALGKTIIITVDEYVPKKFCKACCFGYKYLGDTTVEYPVSLDTMSKIFYDVEMIYDDFYESLTIPCSKSSVRIV